MFDWVLFFKCFLDEFVINWLISGDFVFVLFWKYLLVGGIFFEVNFIFSFYVFLFKFKIGIVLDIDLIKKKNCLEF